MIRTEIMIVEGFEFYEMIQKMYVVLKIFDHCD